MSEAASITVRVPLAIRRRPGRKTVVTPVRDSADAALPTRADPVLVKALARAFRYQRLLEKGRYASISEMAAAERIDRGYLGRVLQLTLLAPDIVEAILDGRPLTDRGLPALMESFPLEWDAQCSALSDSA
ncbi:MAG: Phage protein [uncultured Craurococcus sp.]|uniref:Phage protein n=1 Tax=uncultured Craurococcus sp. TaxID=1135998 RepID=A0A6J4HL64_9PROT|nr:MAG: Phage protein [uncultured Craurococcus sp.]